MIRSYNLQTVIIIYCYSLLLFRQEQHFPFLGIQPNITFKAMRHRTLFYTAIGRFLMVDLGEDSESFIQFLLPLTCEYCIEIYNDQFTSWSILLLTTCNNIILKFNVVKFEQFKNQIASASVNEEQVKVLVIILYRTISKQDLFT